MIVHVSKIPARNYLLHVFTSIAVCIFCYRLGFSEACKPTCSYSPTCWRTHKQVRIRQMVRRSARRNHRILGIAAMLAWRIRTCWRRRARTRTRTRTIYKNIKNPKYQKSKSIQNMNCVTYINKKIITWNMLVSNFSIIYFICYNYILYLDFILFLNFIIFVTTIFLLFILFYF